MKLIAIDMDETLLRENKTYDVERCRHLFKELHQMGHLLCIASGNALSKLQVYFDKEVQSLLYFASDNGNRITKDNEMLEILALTREQLNEVVPFFESHEGYHVVIATDKHAYVTLEDSPMRDEIASYFEGLTTLNSFDEIPEDEHLIILSTYSHNGLDAAKEIAKEFTKQFPDIEIVTSEDVWMDAYHKEGGKGNAIKYLQEKYHISPEDTLAFGDSMNDECMMHEAKYSIAMGNADPDLVKACRYQIGSNEDQAVLSTLEQFIRDGNLDFLEENRIK